jgi:hypothetical protein
MNPRTEADSVQRNSRNPQADASARAEWRGWGEQLRRHGLDGIAAWLLDAVRPVALLSAQLLYMGSPLLGDSLGRLAALLESDEAVDSFASCLDPHALDGRERTGGGR